MVHQISCMLLLICLAGINGSETEQGRTIVDTYGPSSVVIGGVDVVTLGILYGFQCSASCYPACNFAWTWGNVTSQGPELSLKLTQLQAAQNLTCTAVNPDTGRSVTAHKMLQVAAGPSNIQISGPEFIPEGVMSYFTCSTECYPSCNYTWSTVSEGIPFNIAQGNSVSITPLAGTVSAPLTCKAQNTLSHLYISTTLLLQVPDGPSSVVIGGVDVMTVGILYHFQCSASCNPSCQFSWTWGNMTSEGSELNLRILHEELSLNLTCTAVNPATGKSVSVQKVLQVTDGPSSVVIRGVDVVTLGILYGFQCLASCYPACNFTWTWGNVTSQGPELSLKLTQLQAAQNLTCTAVNPDTGRSVTAHKMLQVAAGPSNIQISGPEFLPAGIVSNFTCSAECYPSCNYTWSTVSEGIPFNIAQGNSVSITPLPGTLSASLTCKAQNTLSHLYISTTLLLQVPDGPSSVVIGGVDVMTVGILYHFQCSASCNPSCQFSWTWGNMTFEGSELNLQILQEELSLNLMCTAVNPVTGKSVSVQKVLQVTDGPSSVVIGGVDVVTLGILYGFQCLASCYPTCNFTWTWGDVTSQGPELSLKLTQLQAAQNLTCTAVNPDTGRSVTAHKMLQVAAGPSNIQINGPEFLPAGVVSNFTCSAECYPSCNYTWSTVSEGIVFSIPQGNSVSIIPFPGTLSASLTCKAQDTLSHLYISTTLPLWVAWPDGSPATHPEQTSAVLLLAFIISAAFTL